MIFTSFDYITFFLLVYTGYWLLGSRSLQNSLLLICSYLFYGWVHPWFCLLIATSTTVDFLCGYLIASRPTQKKWFLLLSCLVNLGILSYFKYFNFFIDSFRQVLDSVGLNLSLPVANVLLPVGISFYTFQTLSYTIDVYRGKMKPTTNFIDFALFVSFFPQLVAGPIERAVCFLPQIQKRRHFTVQLIQDSYPLLIRGYLKKLVIADNVAVLVDKIFLLESPSALLLFAGGCAFALQIYADFSAYTDIARGSARLLGFQLSKNFNSPYLAVSPSDFWRRWHMSLSTWIRDYLYIPLGGSRVGSTIQYGGVIFLTMGLVGLWHGAANNFVIWGLYNGALIFIYQQLGFGSKWQPQTLISAICSRGIMLFWVIIGWIIFRSPDLTWLTAALGNNFAVSGRDEIVVAAVIFSYIIFYSFPMVILSVLDRFLPRKQLLYNLFYGVAISVILCFSRETGQDFIYFQF